MQNKSRIILGLLIFVGAVTSPIFYNMGKANARPVVDLNTPVIQQLSTKECVEPAEYMRENHMQLLLSWRDQVVREGKTVYVNSQGKAYEMSLENTCFKCHNETSTPISTPSAIPTSNPASATKAASATSGSASDNQFCYSCHEYASVQPNCWSCHSEPKGATK